MLIYTAGHCRLTTYYICR